MSAYTYMCILVTAHTHAYTHIHTHMYICILVTGQLLMSSYTYTCAYYSLYGY